MEQFEIFPWNASFETGIAEIDEQHKNLVSLLNKLASHFAFGGDAVEVNAILSELTRYVEYHFESEEKIWEEAFIGDSWNDLHIKSHSEFIAKIAYLSANKELLPYDDLIRDLVSFLTHWFTYHILESDKRMAKALRASSTGLSLEQAKILANNEMSGATQVLIDTTMIMYHKLAVNTMELAREIGRRRAVEDELKELTWKADVASRAKSAFLANMSHEIRTPLYAISGNAYRLLHDSALPQQIPLLKNIELASKHLLAIINDILDLSKIEAGKFEIGSSSFSVIQLLDELLSVISERTKEKKLHLSYAISDVPEILEGDANCIKQALMNYVGNAIKFTETGSVSIQLSKLEENTGSILIRFEVRDTGIGIAPSDIDRLFQHFEQLDYSSSRQYGGTGLGLAIVKKLAEMMGGTVGVESILGKGSCFWFTAYLKKSSIQTGGLPEENQLNIKATAKSFAGAKVLLAEDDPFSQEVTKWMLESFGLTVDCATNGKEALDMATSNQYALILMDLQMPVMGGLDATRHIRSSKAGKEIPILALTANAFEEDRKQCEEAGMNDFITKPIELDKLQERLSKWIQVGAK